MATLVGAGSEDFGRFPGDLGAPSQGDRVLPSAGITKAKLRILNLNG